MIVRRGLSDAAADIPLVLSTPSVFDTNVQTDYSGMQLTLPTPANQVQTYAPVVLPSSTPPVATAAPTPSPGTTGDWFSQDVLPIVNTAVNATASVVKAFATPTTGLPAGVSPLALSQMTPAQQQAYYASLNKAANPFSAQLSSMLPTLLLSAGAFFAFKMLAGRR
jgi:hypothetical protein